MNPFRILGISEDATPEQIDSAYREKARKYHPDAGGDAWAFQQVQEAYEALRGVAGEPARARAGRPPHSNYDRRAIKRMAKEHFEKLCRLAAAGESPLGCVEEHRRELKELAAGLPPQEAVEFYNTWTEELNALTEEANARTAALNRKTEEMEARIAALNRKTEETKAVRTSHSKYDRRTIQRIAREHGEKMHRLAAAGESTLGYRERELEKLVAGLPSDEVVQFYNTYTEELNTIIAETKARTAALNRKTEETRARTAALKGRGRGVLGCGIVLAAFTLMVIVGAIASSGSHTSSPPPGPDTSSPPLGPAGWDRDKLERDVETTIRDPSKTILIPYDGSQPEVVPNPYPPDPDQDR